MSTQTVFVKSDAGWRTVPVPAADTEILPGIPWGSTEQHLTPAFWYAAALIHAARAKPADLRSGRTLAEETVSCLLGGFGIKAEVAEVAFDRLQERGVLLGPGDAAEIEQQLSSPFELYGRSVRYRYPRLKAGYIAGALKHFREHTPPDDDLKLRDWLLAIPGVGLKTASWVVRNWRYSDRVAILDIHVIRAGTVIDLFDAKHRVERDYRLMEERFLAFAVALGIPAGILDLLIWTYMRSYKLWELYGEPALRSRQRSDATEADAELLPSVQV